MYVYIYIYIYMISISISISISGVCETNTPPGGETKTGGKKKTGGMTGSFGAPNRGLESSFYCWTSWPRLA